MMGEPPNNHADPQWPKAMQPEAFYGLAGDIAQVLDPHTESDPVAVLIQFLIAFGNVIGRNAYFRTGADQHYTNEFAVVVGATSKGRKGSSWSVVRHIMGMADPGWLKSRVVSGLSSGEGLQAAVRDQITIQEPIRAGKDRKISGYQSVIKDPGVTDKRLTVVEQEFASTLRVAQRDGNTLSAVIRQSWDTGQLSVLTKNNPVQATGAHISIVGHVTKDELLKYLTETEAGNGFANRHLWALAKRSKLLPDGGRLDEVDYAPLLRRLRDAIEFGRTAGEIKRDEEAGEMWREVYRELSRDRFGLFGAVTSRAEAHALRLSCIYALLDRSPVVRMPHLAAALSVWSYSENSCRYIFGDSLGDITADTIRAALRRNPNGLTRTEISRLFDRHKSSAEVTRALELLRSQQMAESSSVPPKKGRPEERWFAI